MKKREKNRIFGWSKAIFCSNSGAIAKGINEVPFKKTLFSPFQIYENNF
jgi:hypothetical protein